MRNLNILKKNALKFDQNHVESALYLAIDGVTPAVYISALRTIFNQSGEYIVDLDSVPNVEAADCIVHIEYLIDQHALFFATKRGLLGCCDSNTKEVSINAILDHVIESVAFSPDFDVITVITEDRLLVILDRNHSILVKTNVEPEGFGQDAFVTVGWGKKETQFHGSEGKAAALTKKQELGSALAFDDKKSRICWRGDGEFFVVSSYDSVLDRRNIRVWTREGIHSTTAEPVSGLGQCLAWRPSGNLIASAQMDLDAGLHQIVFFERNGLRHGEFELPKQFSRLKVVELCWNADSTVLAIWLQSADLSTPEIRCYLSLWTMANYHWYMKKCFDFSNVGRRLERFAWDPNETLRIHLLIESGVLESIDFCWGVGRISGPQAIDSASCVAVIDGASLLITEFSKCVVPPPMAGQTIDFNDGFINDVHVESGKIHVLLHDGRVARVSKSSKDQWEIDHIFSFDSCSTPHDFYKFVTIDNHIFTASCNLPDGDTSSALNFDHRVDVWSTESDKYVRKNFWNIKSAICKLCRVSDTSDCVLSLADGDVMISKDRDTLTPLQSVASGDCLKFNDIRCDLDVVYNSDDNQIITVSRNNRNQLFVDSKEIASDVNSYIIHDNEYLLVTTLTHQLYCLRLKELLQSGFNLASHAHSARKIERGSRLVVTVADQMKVILQMPRGNLETIFPRELILRLVKNLLDNCDYKKCMSLMKRHRLDTNLIFDHDPMKFMRNIDNFVEAVDDTLMLNVFLSELKREDVTRTMYKSNYESMAKSADESSFANKINEICVNIRRSLMRPEFSFATKHFTTVLTTYVKMDPPDFDSALMLIKKYRDEMNDLQLVDDGMRHLLYLSDVNVLVDVALGTYDFDLVLMVIEKSQKDPKEFLPFLNELNRLPAPYRMFKIDSHLRRYSKALKHIINCGDEKFEEGLRFIKQHGLFVEALSLYESSSHQYAIICEHYAEFLANNAKFVDSGLFYELAGQFDKAALSYTKINDPTWFVNLVKTNRISTETIDPLGRSFALKLRDSRCFKDAAKIYIEILHDAEKSIDCLLEGQLYVEAYHLILQESKPELIENCLRPALEKFLAQNCDVVKKCKQSYENYTQRLKIVRASKREKLDQAVCYGDHYVDDDTYSEVGSTISTISTKASTNARAKRIAAKKEEKKRHVLKENSPYEDLALLNALTEIVRQVEQLQCDIPSALQLSVLLGLHQLGKSLQDSLKDVIKLVESSIDSIWPLTVDLSTIPGPLGENVSTMMGDHFNLANAHSPTKLLYTSNASIRIDPLMIRPRLTTDLKWLVDFYK